MSKKKFFSAFIRQGRHIGAVAPSSRFLVNKMLEPIDFNQVKCIVEFGPGTGSLTHELLNRMPKDSILLAFEINEEFCEILKSIEDSRLHIIRDSAENLEKHLEKLGLKKVDHIVSSLPLAMIPNAIVSNILREVRKVLKEDGRFLQYQYSLNAYGKLRNTFKKVTVNFTMMNIPPAFVFICSNYGA